MEIKDKVGWVVCQKKKTVDKAKMVCPSDDGYDPYEVNGLSGFIYIYNTKKCAIKDCDSLNNNWKGKPFIVKKAKISII